MTTRARQRQWQRRPCTAMLCLLPALAFFTRPAHSAEFVDGLTDDVGLFNSIALDSAGFPHCSYYDNTKQDLRYASRESGSWVTEPVDTLNKVGLHTSLAIDGTGNPHISYFYDATDNLRYAVKIAGVWALETVDVAGNVGFNTSIALDGSGHPRISYHDASKGDLKFAEKNAGVWSIVTVDSLQTTGSYTSLALNSAGEPSISYHSGFPSRNLRFATRSGGAWTTETVDAPGTVGLYTSLALDAAGEPHISYYDATNGWTRYAFRDAGAWTIEVVDSASAAGSTTSIAIDANGAPLILYKSGTTPTLRLARRLNQIWSSVVVEPGPHDSGTYGSLALDAFDSPHIAFYDGTEGALYYSTVVVTSTASASPFSGITFEARPNPAVGGRTTIVFPQAAGRAGGVEIYDLRGRLVRTLGSGASWEGRDDAGRQVPAGAYFIRLPGRTETRKILVLR